MYFFVIVFAAIYWIIYGNWIGGCLMASLFLVLFYSIWYCKKERKQINFKIKANDWVVTQGEEFKIFLEVSGSSLWMDDHLFEIEYEVETKLHGTKEQKKSTIRWNKASKKQPELIETAEVCDNYTINIKSVSWEDFTGMYKVKKDLQQKISILVMPVSYELEMMNEKLQRIDLLEQGFEYDGVRNYQEGDKLSKIHWNLYASTKQLFVRMNEEDELENIKIGIDLSQVSKDRICDYLCVFYLISKFYIEAGLPQEIYYGDHKFFLNHIEQYEELFLDIFSENGVPMQTDENEIWMIRLDDDVYDIQKYLYDMEL